MYFLMKFEFYRDFKRLKWNLGRSFFCLLRQFG